jgi:hypothetical protein
VVHAQLQHCDAVVRTQPKQGQWHPNVVIEIALGRQGMFRLPSLNDGSSKLTTFLVPDLEDIKKTLNEKKI